MNHLIETLNDAAATWAPTMFAILWQSTLLAALVAAACWALRRQSPRLRYLLWLLLAAKLLVLPLWTVAVPWPRQIAPRAAVEKMAPVVTSQASPTTPDANDVVENDPNHSPRSQSAPPALPFTWQAGLLLLWLAVVIAAIARTAWQFRGLRRLLAAARAAPPEVVSIVAECARALGLKSPPATHVIDGEGSPLVFGLIRPRLLIPSATLATLDSAALQQIVLHELAHIRRHDLWTVWVIQLVRTLNWFHPVAHWIAYRAGLERELACDELALIHSGAAPAAYARTLVRAVSATSQPLVLTAAAAARLDGGFPEGSNGS